MHFRFLPKALKWRPQSSIPLLALIATTGALTWTLLGLLVSVIGRSINSFWHEWLLIQGFFAVAAALFLGLLAISPSLANALRQLATEAPNIERWNKRAVIKNWRWVTIAFVTVVGSITTTHLGFSVTPPARYFMWLTCVIVCVFAGLVTWHSVEVIYTATRIEKLKIKFFVYSPGETLSLKRLAVHYVTFGLGMTFGYIFAFVGTMSPLWTGNPILVRTVQAFWPLIYVPLCLVIVTYPHLAIHRLIRREKDRLILNYQEEINSIIGGQSPMSQQDIERINALANLIRNIENSPSFAVNFPIVIGTGFVYIANIGSLFVPKELVAEVIHKLLPP
jgi:hypothetical protein